MICKNCGTEFSDEGKFCPVCGKAVEASQPVENPQVNEATENAATDSAAYFTPASDLSSESSPSSHFTPASDISPESTLPDPTPGFTPPEPPKKKKGKKLPIALASTAAALAVVVTTTVLLWDRIDNFFAKTFMSPEDYYNHVEKENVEDTVKLLYSSLDNVTGLTDRQEGFTGSMKVELGDSMKEFYEIAGIDEEQIDWLENVELTFDADASAEAIDMDLAGNLNGTEIVKTNIILDVENGTGYLIVPDMIDEYVMLELADSSDMTAAMEAYEEELAEFEKVIPSEEVATKLLLKYFELITDSIVAEKESVKLDIEGVSQSCTLITVEIDGKTIITALTAVLEAAVEDEEIEKIIKDFAEQYDEDGDDVYDSFVEGVEDLLEELGDIDDDDIDDAMGSEIVLKTWVNNSGEIIAREIEYDYAEMTFFMGSVEQGSDVATEISCEIQDEEIVKLSGSGKKKSNKVTGNYSLEVYEQEMVELEVKDFDTKKYEDDGYLNGEFYISLGKDVDITDLFSIGMPEELLSLVDDLKLGYIISSSDKEASISMMIMNDDDPYITYTISAKLRDYEEPKIPDEDDCIDGTDEDEMTALFEDIDFEKLISNLEDAGVPSDMLDVIRDGLGI